MPSAINIRPTRLEYIRTKRRIIIAKKGLKLLKLKRQALILEFFNTSKSAASLRSGLQAELIKGYKSIRMAEMLAGSMRLENEAMKIPQLSKLQITPKNVMGVRIPKIDGGQGNQSLTEHLLELPPSINEAIKAFRNVHKMVLDVENVFIPRLEAAVKFITFRLDEMERDTFIMLKTVKRKMGEREQKAKIKKEKEILA